MLGSFLFPTSISYDKHIELSVLFSENVFPVSIHHDSVQKTEITPDILNRKGFSTELDAYKIPVL